MFHALVSFATKIIYGQDLDSSPSPTYCRTGNFLRRHGQSLGLNAPRENEGIRYTLDNLYQGELTGISARN